MNNHTEPQRIPVVRIDPATTTLIELLTVNARLPYPLHMPLYEDVRPDAVCAVRAVAELPGMRLEEKPSALYLWNQAGLLVAVVFAKRSR